MKQFKNTKEKHIYSIATILLLLCCILSFLLLSIRGKSAEYNYSFQRFYIKNPFKQCTNPCKGIDFSKPNGVCCDPENILVQYKTDKNTIIKQLKRNGIIARIYKSAKFDTQIFGQLGNQIYYISRSSLFLSDTTEQLRFNKVKLSQLLINATPINDSTLLVIKNDSITNNNGTSFGILNVKTKQFTQLGKGGYLPENNKYKTYQEQVLAYDGHFLNTNEAITYTFTHIPYIYVFDKTGKLTRIVKTRDNVPAPSIIRYGDFYIFERGKTFNSNVGAFAKGNSLFVLSYRISTHAHYIIDKYDLCKGKYQGSFSVLNKNNMNNKAIDKLLFLNHHVLIVSKDSATVLKVS